MDSLWLYVAFTLAYGYYVTILPGMYLFFVGRMRRPQEIPARPNLRVALVTLCVPSSESMDVIAAQLDALIRVSYPHDSWILDEGGDPAVRGLAERAGVNYFSRSGVGRYNRPAPPFQAKTKAGNVNAWIDAHGASYELFVQLDIDHRPRPDYLDRVLGYFQDPQVAWVQAPSVYGNLDTWVARGAAEQELVLQGPLQQGFFGNSETPFIIGSHTSYRMSAVREIGGFQPTRAEDHLDTLVLASRGYKGVFVPECLALGKGPETFETYLKQQFAWARSIMQVLFRFTPRHILKLHPGQALQFLFTETWYMLWSVSLLALFLLPVVSLITGARPTSTPLPLFLLMSAPIGLASFAFWNWTRRWHLPSGLRLSWRAVLLDVARWPVVFWALVNVLLNVQHPYMITPKGQAASNRRFSLSHQAVYLLGAWLGMAAVWFKLTASVHAASSTVLGNMSESAGLSGFALLTLWGSLFMLAVFAVNVIADVRTLRCRGDTVLRVVRLRALPIVLLLATLSSFLGVARASAGAVLDDWRAGRLAGFEVSMTPALPFVNVRTDGAPPSVVGDLSSGPKPIVSATASLPVQDLPGNHVAIGAYDPWQQLTKLPLDIDHFYVRQDAPDTLREALRSSRGARVPLVTIEPFPPAGDSSPVLDNVAAGNRDDQLRALADVVRDAAPQVAYLRWAHEMDLSGLYPWSADDPPLYRAAFRHVVSIFRDEGASNARWVWSPAGETVAPEYYPGDDVVDFVGLTILGDAGWDQNFGLPPRSFADLLKPRYAVVAPLGKPIMICELGVSGTPSRQQAWLEDVPNALDAFPALKAIVYFNAVNSPNSTVVTRPDWRVPAKLLASLATTLGSEEK